MTFWEIVLIGVSLAMDAFAVSVCKGLAMKKLSVKNMLIVGLYFGLFQAGMPLLGYLLGSAFREIVEKIDHWIAFGLLVFIGINMIREAGKDEDDASDGRLDVKTMLLLAVATSIDALAVGVTFAFFPVQFYLSVLIIGVITFALSAAGVLIGHRFGRRFSRGAQILGGVILILLGLRILLSDLGVL